MMSKLPYKQRRVLHAPNEPEQLSRGRRLDLFVKATDLKEVLEPETIQIFISQLGAGFLDHASLWKTQDGVFVLLAEPYSLTAPVVKHGCVIQVPISIAPYGGTIKLGCQQWGSVPLPDTRSYLISHEDHCQELWKLERKLQIAAQVNSIRWDQT